MARGAKKAAPAPARSPSRRRSAAQVSPPAAPAASGPLWPADTVTRRPVAELIPYARNARLHSDAQVAQIAASIREWGWTVPVLVDEAGGIIAGHGRVLAAQLLDLVEIPTMVAVGWTDEQKRAYVIADNQLTINATWNEDLLRVELSDLQTAGFDLALTGFGEEALSILFAEETAGLTDPDAVPATPADPVSRPGDVWLLGRHRIVCGDSRDALVVASALAGAAPNLMVTDPPYGVNYDPSWRQDAGLGEGQATGRVLNDDEADWRDVWTLFPGAVAYVWHGGLHAGAVAESLEFAGFRLRAQIVWVKQRLVISRGHYHWQHEPCWYGAKDGADDHWRFVPEHELVGYAVKDGKPANWKGDRKQSTVWNVEHIRSDTGHGTQKPVECMRRPIINNSDPGDAIFEPFSGSGTTIIAAEMTGRHCHAIELNPAYVDLAVQRWQEFTGRSAVLEGDEGLSFADMMAAARR